MKGNMILNLMHETLNPRRKQVRRYLLIVLVAAMALPLKGKAQDQLPGIWKGLIYTDSVLKYCPYELAISDDHGKVMGYSQTTYTIDGKEEKWVRKLKIIRNGNDIVVEDVSVVDNTLHLPQSKGVKKTSTLTFSISEGEILLTGEWKTNRTNEYVPMHGTIQLLKENDFRKTELFMKLDALKLAKDLSFNKMPEAPKKAKDTVVKPPVVVAPPPPVTPPPPTPPAAEVNARKIASVQTVYYHSDSLLLTLYDNGEVDGDIVSVLLNGKIIFGQQELSTKANSKTVYMNNDMPDSVMLVMYAENLGSIPPNTGLMVINDGNDRYELRFSADLKTNAAIILKRKKPTTKPVH